VANNQQPIRYEEERRYPMSVAEAWRLLADTDHLNRSIGLPAVDFSPFEGGEPLVRRARAKAYGLVPVRWKEFPFDWVRERRYAVRREFESGPIEWLVGGLELEPAEAGVTVKAFAHFTARNVAGRFLWRLGRAPVTGLLAFCDLYLSRKAAGKADPTPVPKTRPAVDRARLEQLLQELGRAPVEPTLIPPLRERILEGSDDQLTSVRAFALADRWQADRHEVLRLLLHATRAGLFELRWQLMCPNCRVAKAEVNTLAELPPRFHCDTCGISYATNLDERVELRFTINPAIRPTSIETYCIGGPLRMPHVLAQQYLSPHEDRRLELELDEPLLLRTIGGSHELSLVRGPAGGRVGEVRLTYAAGRWVGPHSLLDGDSLQVPAGAAVTLRNQTDGPLLAVLEDLDWTADATSAAQAVSLQEFRELFGAELPPPEQQLTVRETALLVSSLELSARRDDDDSSLISRHIEYIRDHVARAGGTLVKAEGSRALCAFQRLEDAADAAIAIQERLPAWCSEQGIAPVTVKLGLHRGPAIAATTDDGLDYLGRTTNIATWLNKESRGGDVVLLAETFDQLPALTRRPELTIERIPARARFPAELESELVRIALRTDAA
jgi:adenylate cyclase